MRRSTKFNFIMNALLTASAFIFPLITYPYISRILGPDNIGKVTFASSVTYYFTIFAQLGIPTYGISACARVRDDKEKLSRTVHEIMTINFAATVFVYVAFAIALFTVPKISCEKPLFLITGISILLNAIGVDWLYRALEQYSYITAVSMVFKLISVCAMFMFVHKPDDYVIYGGMSIIAASGSSILNFIRMRKFVSLRVKGQCNYKRHLRPILIFFAMSVATTIYTNLDTAMIGFIKTTTDVGYYNTAVKVKNILCSLVTSLGAVLLPRMSCLAEQEHWEEFNALVKKALNFVMLIALPLMVYFMLFAKESVLLLSGKEFIPSILPMQVITPTILFIGITNVLGIQVLVPLGKENIVLRSEVAGAIVNVILNAVLIPAYAATGAAIGTVAAEITVLIVQYSALRKDVRSAFLSLEYWKILLSLVSASAAALFIKLYVPLGTFNLLLLSAIAFFGIYALLIYLSKERLAYEIINQIFDKIFRRKKADSAKTNEDACSSDAAEECIKESGKEESTEEAGDVLLEETCTENECEALAEPAKDGNAENENAENENA